MTLKITQENTYSFSDGKWRIIDHSLTSSAKINQVSLGCYNVLFPSNNFFKKIITSDIDRYKYQINELFPKLNIGILALSEVKDIYANMLLSSKWFQKEYYIFDPHKNAFKLSIGNLILSKYPMKCYSMDNIIYGRIAIGLISPLNDIKSSFLVVSTHLTAYEKNYEIRRKQLEKILEGLNAYWNKFDPFNEHFQSAVKNKNIIIMGDLNFHLKYENIFVYSNNLIDLWTETNKGLDGYSWDTKENPFINVLLPFDNRRMRLDRILFTEGSKLFDVIPEERMVIFGKNKVFPNKKLSYLRGSDHFGLKVSINLLEQGNEKEYSRKIIIEEKLEKSHSFRSEKLIIVYRIVACVIILMFLIWCFNFIRTI